MRKYKMKTIWININYFTLINEYWLHLLLNFTITCNYSLKFNSHDSNILAIIGYLQLAAIQAPRLKALDWPIEIKKSLLFVLINKRFQTFAFN